MATTESEWMKKAELPSVGEHIIDYQNRHIRVRNRALKLAKEWGQFVDDEDFDVENEPIVI